MQAETRTPSPKTSWTIGAVERDTGIPKDTLRVWERRYRFPVPGRDAHGERLYSADQIEKLRALKRLIDRGHRPGRIIACSLEELLALARSAGAPAEPGNADLEAIVDLLAGHRLEELRQALGQRLLREGLAGFCEHTVAPLNRRIGEAWMEGRIQVHEEHLYTETIQRLLRQSLSATAPAGREPRVLLTTLPGEEHGLGLLMAEAMLAVEGASCIALGTQTPVRDIVRAAEMNHAQVVALSFSVGYSPERASAGLAELREQLPASVELWAGGENPALARRRLEGVRPVRELGGIAAALARWRGERGGA